MEEDILNQIVIPECNDGIIAIRGDFYLSRNLNLDALTSVQRKEVTRDVCAFIINTNVTTLILNFIYQKFTLYRTRTRIDLVCKIFKKLKDCTPFTIDINDNIFYPDDTLENMIKVLEDKGFTVKCAKIFLHHSLHDKK